MDADLRPGTGNGQESTMDVVTANWRSIHCPVCNKIRRQGGSQNEFVREDNSQKLEKRQYKPICIYCARSQANSLKRLGNIDQAVAKNGEDLRAGASGFPAKRSENGVTVHYGLGGVEVGVEYSDEEYRRLLLVKRKM